MIAKRDQFAQEKTAAVGLVSPGRGRHEDHSPQATCVAIVRQMTRIAKVIAAGNGEDAAPLHKWNDREWAAFELLPPVFSQAYCSKGRYICHVADVGEIKFSSWSWAGESGQWLTLYSDDRHTEIRAAAVTAAALLY